MYGNLEAGNCAVWEFSKKTLAEKTSIPYEPMMRKLRKGELSLSEAYRIIDYLEETTQMKFDFRNLFLFSRGLA